MAVIGPAIANLAQRILPLQSLGPLTSDRLLATFGVRTSVTGASVTPDTALGLTAVHACIQVITDNVASLPVMTYRRLDKGKERAVDHPVFTLLHDAPNPWMSPFVFKETLMGHLLLWGNAYAEIVRDKQSGQPVALWPLRPSDIQKIQRSASGELIYTYRVPSSQSAIGSQSAGDLVEIPQRNMLHLRGLSSDGVIGYSPITLHREALGLALAAEEYGARFFGNNSTPGGVLQAKTRLSDGAVKNLKESWEAAHRGLSESHRVAILEEGVEWKQIGLPPEDAQFIEARTFQLQEICRIFRIPPHKAGDLTRATYSNIEKQEQQFMIDCLRPWLVRWEEQMTKDLLVVRERAQYDIEFLMEGQLRADIKTRYDAYGVGRQWGWLSVNDIREFENMNPVEGGDEYLTPANMMPLGTVPPALQEGGEEGESDEEDSEDEERSYELMLRDVMQKRGLRRTIERDADGRIVAVNETPLLEVVR